MIGSVRVGYSQIGGVLGNWPDFVDKWALALYELNSFPGKKGHLGTRIDCYWRNARLCTDNEHDPR